MRYITFSVHFSRMGKRCITFATAYLPQNKDKKIALSFKICKVRKRKAEMHGTCSNRALSILKMTFQPEFYGKMMNSNYSRASVARTLMARLPLAVSNSFWSPLEKFHRCRFRIT